MSRTSLIRLSGLAAMVGLLYVLQASGVTLEPTEKALQKGHYQNPVAMILLVGVLAAIVALHLLQRGHYGRWGALTALAAFAGVAMVAVGGLAGELFPSTAQVAIDLLIGGVLAASVGVIGLGTVTIDAGVLPQWCGIALIAGSPPGVGALFMFSTLFVTGSILPGGMWWSLARIPWMLVGYTILRAGGQLLKQPPRVR